MKLEGTKGAIASIGFGILVIIIGIYSILTYETARNPYRAVMRGGVMIVAGIVIIVCDIITIIRNKKDNE